MGKSASDVSISEIQKEIERFSEGEDSETPSDESSRNEDTYGADVQESDPVTSDEEAEVDLNDLTSLLTKPKRKAKETSVQDVDTLMSKTKFDVKREKEANEFKKKKAAELAKHQAGRETTTPEKEETYSSKAWHVPLFEVPRPGLRRKNKDK